MGWKRAFCTSIFKEKENRALPEKQLHGDSTNQSPRVSSKFGFFSNPSTPRFRSQPVSSPSLRCRTTKAKTTSTSSVPSSPKVHCSNNTTPKKSNSPRLFQFSNPSSPKSPSSFSLFKASLRLSKSRCGICTQSVKTGHGTAILTAECSHIFHFPCVAAHVKKHQSLLCPVCSTSWKELPLLATHGDNQFNARNPRTEYTRASKSISIGDINTKTSKVYDDDEPLMSPTSVARFFNPIPESDETEEQDNDQDQNSTVEFQGFFVNSSSPRKPVNVKSIELKLLQEAAIVALSKTYETYVAVLKVKAPSSSMLNGNGICRIKPNRAARRASLDLVTVLDVGGSMTGAKLQMMKRSMRLVISSLGPTDRLSIVAYSSTSKRVLPLRRMNPNGQRSARRIVDALVYIHQNREAHVKSEALKKAAKVLEDRRDRNLAASILLLADGQDELAAEKIPSNQKHSISSHAVTHTRFGHLEFQVHTVGLTDGADYNHSPPEADAIAKCVGGLLSVVVQDLQLQLGVVSRSVPAEIAGVYALSGWPSAIKSGSGLVGLGDLYAEEEKELLVELRVPAGSLIGSHHVLTVRYSYRDPSTQELVRSKEQALLLPRPQAVRSAEPEIERLRNMHVSYRAVAESRRLMEHNDMVGAYHLLSSARALLMRSDAASAEEYLRWLELELSKVQRRRQHEVRSQSRHPHGQNQRQRESGRAEEKVEPLTPTSAWKAAERLAKVANMKKSMNRVSDLHGFENARF